MSNTDLINDFSTYLKENNKTLSTITAYLKDITQLAEHNLSKSLIEFSTDDIRHFLDYLHRSQELTLKTISRKINSIRTFYKFLGEKNLVDENPALAISHPKYKEKKQRILATSEYLALREISRNNLRLHTMIEIILQTGVRISELSNIKLVDVTLKGSKSTLRIKQYSSNPERLIPLNNKICWLLNIYMGQLENKNSSYYLFSTKTGKNIEIRNIRSSIDRAIVKAQIKNACVNDLRNTFIVFQLSRGMPISSVSEIVGHKNINTTYRYLSLLPKKYKENKNTNGVFEL